MKRTKLLLIGWDAADWAVLNPLLADGKMPALASLMNGGIHGRLASIQPMLSPLLWTSVATGFRPHDHGILNFVEVDKAGKVRAVRGASRTKKAFWEILHERSINSNVIGWWPSHPAENSGGVQVSNFFNRTSDLQMDPMPAGTVFPQERAPEYEELRLHATEMTARILAPFFPHVDEISGSDPVLSSTAKIIAHASGIHTAATQAMATTDWDVTAVYLDALDHFKHLAMAYHPPKSDFVSEEDYRKYGGIVEAGYRFHDMMLDRLLELAGEDCHVLLVSDHGFAQGSERMRETPDIPGGPASEHHPYGVLIGKGPGWKSGEVYGTSLLDICPAILHLFDTPVASDMVGRVPAEWWINQSTVRYIDHYSERTADAGSNDSGGQALLDDLAALGYIDLPENEAEARRAVEGDSGYHRVTSLLDAGLWITALEASEQLCIDFPDDPRFAYQLLGIRLMQNHPSFSHELRRVAERFPSPAADYFQGINALKEGYYETALNYFESVLTRAESSPSLMVTIGRALIQAGRTAEAEEWLSRSIRKFDRSAECFDLLAEISETRALKNGDEATFEQALNLSLEAIQRRYYFPEAHLRIARVTDRMKQYEASGTAYLTYMSMRPFDISVIDRATEILSETGRNSEAAYWQSLHSNRGWNIIVTGWPRSGTSLMMNMLRSGGVQVYEDDSRLPDEHNPRGFFEHGRIKTSHIDVSWLEEAAGKVAKVVLPQFRHLPGTGNYLVIWMDRPLSEVILSQEVMKGKKKRDVLDFFPFHKAMQMESESAAILKWAEASGNISVLKVKYHDCFDNTAEVVKSLSDFLEGHGIKTDKEAMTSAVDEKLRRNRL